MGRLQEGRHEQATGEEAWEGYRRGGMNRLQVRKHDTNTNTDTDIVSYTDMDTDMDNDMDCSKPEMAASWTSGVPPIIIC